MKEDEAEMGGVLTQLCVFLAYVLIVVFGYFRETLDSLTGYLDVKCPSPGYPPALSRIETFFVRRLYARLCGCFNRPIASKPGARVDVMKRRREGDMAFSRKFRLTGETISCLNLASYNYLGFCENSGPVNDSVIHSVRTIAVSQCSPRLQGGSLAIHTELEEAVARFVGKEAAIVWGMGWGVNATGISSIAGKGSLIISDSLNHASLVVGCRASGGVVRVFKHNDVKNLEATVRRSIVDGQPLTHRPWKKIIILIEGTYSMEGQFPPLKEIVAIKKKYRCYLYIDEAHSIGAIGPTGRGITEHFGVDPADVDILMGTFTKSFGAAGGYMASTRQVIDHIRTTSFAMFYDNAMPAPVAQQTLSALRVISGEDGTDDGKRRIAKLRENSQYFRSKLREMKFQIIGDDACPIIPLMIFHPVKLYYFSEECLQKGIAVAIVSFPATPLTLSRARFCLSSGHTKEDLDRALEVLEELGSQLMLKYQRSGWDRVRALLWD